MGVEAGRQGGGVGPHLGNGIRSRIGEEVMMVAVVQ